MIRRKWLTALYATAVVTASVAYSAPRQIGSISELPDDAHLLQISSIYNPQPAPETTLRHAIGHLEKQNPQTALSTMVDLETVLPHVADFIYFIRGQCFSRLNRYEEAALAFGQAAAVKGSRWTDRALARRVEMLLKARQYATARSAADQLIRAYPDSPDRPQWEFWAAMATLGAGNVRIAAKKMLSIWSHWPADDAAQQAYDLLAALRLAAPDLPRPTAQQWYEHGLRLRSARRYADAISAFERAEQLDPSLSFNARAKAAYAKKRSGRIEEAINAYGQLLPRATGSWKAIIRRHLADTLAQSDRMDEALSLYSDNLDEPGTQSSLRKQRAIFETSKLLSRHGRYEDAYEIYQQLPLGTPPAHQDRRRHLAWLAYRAGDFDRAIALFSQLRRGDSDPFCLYWRARAHQAAGQPAQAIDLYQRLVASDLPTGYYGLLARSRLAAAGLAVVPEGQCTFAPQGRPSIGALLANAVRQFGDLLPGLRQAQTYWRIGLYTEARSALRMVALDYAWSALPHYRVAFAIRDIPLRVWAGTAVQRVRWGKRQLNIRQQAKPLRAPLAQLLRAADLGYFAWRLGPTEDDIERRRYPRAFERLVLRTAQHYDIDPNLIWAIARTESAFRPDAISRVQAGGLVQLMPRTAQRLAEDFGMPTPDMEAIFDPETNLMLGGAYLKALTQKFRGQIPLVAAAYNGGPHNVAKWLDYRGARSNMDEFIEEIPYTESKRYAKKVVRLIALYRRVHCGRDNFTLSNTLTTEYAPYPNF